MLSYFRAVLLGTSEVHSIHSINVMEWTPSLRQKHLNCSAHLVRDINSEFSFFALIDGDIQSDLGVVVTIHIRLLGRATVQVFSFFLS